MFETLKSMKSITTTELEGLTLEEVVLKFQNTQDISLQNKCYAYVFCNIFPMLLKIHHKFNTLSTTERTEECLSCTLHSMRKYNTDKKVKFTTFIYGNLTRSFITLSERLLNNNKHKIWSNLTTMDSSSLNYILRSVRDKDRNQEYRSYLLDLENSSILSQEEIDFCKTVIFGFRNNKEIAKQMKLTETSKYDKKLGRLVSVPLDEESATKYVATIKRNVKRKILQNNNSAI